MKNSPAMMAAFERIAQARVLHRCWLAAGVVPFDCANILVDPSRKLALLSEHVGTISKRLTELEKSTRKGRVFAREDLQNQLAQTAAVLVAWLESFED